MSDLTRRDALLLGGAGLLALGAAGCRTPLRLAEETAPAEPRNPKPRDLASAMDAFGFGPSPADGGPSDRRTPRTWFEAQLEAPEEDGEALSAALRRLDIFHFSAFELRDMPQWRVVQQLETAAVLRAVYSPWQLRERMVDFLTNHLNIAAGKGVAAYRKPTDEREVVRRHVFGRFEDLILASARSTAMLVYLDQQASSAAEPNENYARELLELHTLGVDGGYTQKDVMEAARAFTGWTEQREFLRAKGRFRFRPELHDQGPKRILGVDLPGGRGVEDGEDVVRIACRHPATARHMARKLGRFFLGVEEGPAVDAAAEAFRNSNGDLKTVLRSLFASWESGQARPAVKRPFDFLASSLRAVGAETDGGPPLIDHLRQMGQPLYQWPMPDGYPIDAEAWTGSMLGRWNFAFALMHNRIDGTRVPDSRRLQGDERSILGRRLDGLASDTPADRIALALAGPDFQWRT
ncbi:MAG: DUF1800 domain-containing protein [Fimbriimonadaceae bacterium]|nr:DUF1800 domain-containing protein [Fimbriimonadaceae bacterium]